uniref:Mitochondrial folate transporter/carrier n=1 Tax=Steinernema glaseri TaxID=37863 RepID=A0A1I7YBS1_9BILA
MPSIVAGYENLIAGFSGGFVSTIVCHPLDLLKIRYSANEGSQIRPQYRSYLHAARSVIQAEGFRGIYQGLTPNIVGATLSWGLYFQFFYALRQKFTLFPEKFQSANDLIIGCLSGSAVMCVTNPVWVTKTRLCLQYETEGPKKYSGMWDCMKQIVKNEGVAGLYKGFVPGILGTTHGADTVDYLAFSIISKVFATTTTYPYQVLRTRLQDQHVKYDGVVDVIRTTMKAEGISGLYKGMLMANIRVLPAAMVTFVTFENVKHFLA